MSLPGRCSCGVRLDLAAQYPDDHMLCRGEKRCAGCGETKREKTDFFHYGPHRQNRPFARCKVCWKVNAKRKYQTNERAREKRKADARKFYEAHKLAILERKARYYRAHVEEERARARAWGKLNREKNLARQRRYQAQYRELIARRRKLREMKRAA